MTPSGRRSSGVEDQEAAERAQEVTQRAIRRLDALEWIGYALAAVVAILGGAAVAWMVAEPSGFDFRTVWIVSSLVLLVVPGIWVFRTRDS